MPILTTSYFTDKLFIPNSVNIPDIQAGLGTPSNISKLNSFIDTYERLLLVNALGSQQYNDLIAHAGDISGKWYELINGKTYDNKVFNGLREIIAYYVYVHFLKYDPVQFSTTGLERPIAANSVMVDTVSRLVDYWNTFVHIYQTREDYCGCTSGVSWPIYWFNEGSSGSNFVSLYQYLKDHEGDDDDEFSLDYFKFYLTQNVLGV